MTTYVKLRCSRLRAYKVLELVQAVSKSAEWLLSKLRQQRNHHVAPINQLPPEILAHILKHVIRRNIDYQKNRRLLRLTSAWWAEVIDGDPSFWTFLACMDPSQSTELGLKKSGSLPVEVHLLCQHIPTPDDDSDDYYLNPQSHSHEHFFDMLGTVSHIGRSLHMLSYPED